MDSITGKDGELLPFKVVTVPEQKPVTLKIVSPATTSPGSVSSTGKPGVATLPVLSKVKKVESDDELSDEHESEDESEPEEGFYVELALTCTDEDGEQENKHIIFNFENEDTYVENGENGYEDLEGNFEDAISTHYPGWTYAGEWEEHHIHGNELPEDDELPVVDVQ